MTIDLRRAVDLAAWLIATRRQPPQNAVRIAARRYDVDRHEVAQLVGQRGGRKAAKRRREIPDASAQRLPAVPSTTLESAWPEEVLTISVISTEACGAVTRLTGRLLDGPRANETMDFDFPASVVRSVRTGDLMEFLASYAPGAHGRPRVILHEALRVLPAAAAERAR